MVMYHGSSVGGIRVLSPNISEHKEPYVYFSTNPIVAAFYMVHIVEKPFSWFPYGFNEKGIPVYSEYYPNALEDVYGGKKGFLYECKDVADLKNPTNIPCAFASSVPVSIDKCAVFNDIYDEFKKFDRQGELIIKKHNQLSEKELMFAKKYLSQLIIENDLKDKQESKMSMMIIRHFPEVWEATLYR